MQDAGLVGVKISISKKMSLVMMAIKSKIIITIIMLTRICPGSAWG